MNSIGLIGAFPMYAPGKDINFDCGNPNWGAASDQNFKLERRPKWLKNGGSQITLDFHKKVFSASNLLGIFTEHIHNALSI